MYDLKEITLLAVSVINRMSHFKILSSYFFKTGLGSHVLWLKMC